MRVLWTHNFNPLKPNTGCFMHTSANGLRALGVDVQFEFLGNLRSPWNVLAARKRVRLRARDFDVVHAQYGSACAFVTAGVDDRPTAVTVRGNDWNLHNETFHPLYFHTRLARAMTRGSLGKFSAVLPVSNRLAKEIAQEVTESRINVMPSPIDLTLWKPRMYATHVARNVLFTANAPRDPIKRFSLCERTIAIVKQNIGDVTLKIASGISHTDMPSFVATCDAVLCTSETEGWPNSVKEALACNVPFVSTDVSDLSKIADQENTCRVCEPNPNSLARNLCEVLRSPRSPSLRRHVEHMDLKPSCERLIHIYKSLVKN